MPGVSAARRLALLLLVFCLSIVAAVSASAETRRLALVVGNNEGYGGEVDLRYAEADARRVAATLRELGGFDQVRQLHGRPAEDVLREIRALTHTIKSFREDGHETMLLFYFSGHGNDTDLHLGRSNLSSSGLMDELLAVGATLSVVVIDACASGSFTRLKGIRAKEPVKVSLQTHLKARGLVVLASTNVGVAAQDSERLRGSFFTSYFLTGLRGPADVDGNGVVDLQEACKYAYGRTVGATMASSQGVQRPSHSACAR